MESQFITQKFLKDILSFILLVTLSLTQFSLSSQNQLEPGVEWKSVTWPANGLSGPQTQSQSGEDWWYAHKNLYINGVQEGYITVGYTSLISHSVTHSQLQSIFNEGSDSPVNPICAIGSTLCSPDGIENVYTYTAAALCGDRDYVGMHRSPIRGVFGRIGNKGEMVFCKSKMQGELLNCVQDPTTTSVYVVGNTWSVKAYPSHSVFIPYNPTSGSPNNYFSMATLTAAGSPTNYAATVPHLYVAKLDIDGNVIWQGLYGMPDFSGVGAYNCHKNVSTGFDIIYTSGDFLIAVGRDGSEHFVVKIDPTTGFVLDKTEFPTNTHQNSYSLNNSGGTLMSAVEIGTTQVFVVGGNMLFPVPNPPAYDDYHRAVLYCINSSLSPTIWPTNPILIPGTYTVPGTNPNSNLFDLKYDNSQVYAAVLRDCSQCLTPGGSGEAAIYRFATTGTLVAGGGVTNPSILGDANAFDCRVGVSPTSDGGFIAVTSTSAGVSAVNHVTATSSELGYLNSCNDFTNTFYTWDTDPFIVKFDNTGSTEWNKTFDIYKNRPREQPLSDTKRAECMYKISETDDGGFAISGNCSYNFDDYYMAKLYNPCNASLSYDVFAPRNTVTSITGTTTVWNSSKKVMGLVVVEPGALLTITGPTTEIQFADSRRGMVPTGLIIMPGTGTATPGGRLNITNGAHLTSISNTTCPGSMWDGIQVVGTSTANQQIHNTTGFATYQGLVSINGATISNAYNGITTVLTNESGIHWNTTGVIILADNAFFINNERDIQFLSYTNPQNSNLNRSEFKRCHFLTNSILNNSVAPTGHVSMWNVRGVKIEGCEFAYSAGAAYPDDRHGYGIYSIDAQYNVKDYCTTAACTTFTQSSFINLSRAVEAYNSNPLRVVNVDHAIITNTSSAAAASYIGGIDLSSVKTAQITRNTIHLSFTNSRSYGISVNNCQNYAVSNNTITGNWNTVGVYAISSGEGKHKIYRNYISAVDVGILPEFMNAKFNYNTSNPLDKADGLVMNCNTFTTNTNNYDIAMLGYNITGLEPCVAENQGTQNSVFTRVRNQYNANCSNDNKWYVDAGTAKTIAHAANSQANTRPNDQPNCTNSLVNVFPGPSLNYTAHCLENETSPASTTCIACARLADINTGLHNAIELRNILQDTYNSTIDGGDTETLRAQVYSGTVTTMYSDLLALSPYLSDVVLVAYISNTSTPVDKVIGLHNANRPVTSEVWGVINDRAFDPRDVDTLEAHQALDPISARRAMEDELGRSKAELQFVYSEKINYFLSDTLETATDSVINLITANTGELADAKAQLLDAYINGGHFSRAFVYADSLKNDDDYEELMTLKLTLLELDTAVSGIYKLQTDADLFGVISEYAQDSTKAGCWLARSILKEVFVSDMNIIRLLPPEPGGSKLAGNQTQSPIESDSFNEELLQDAQLLLYPNPTNGSFNLLYSFPEEIELTYSIRDILGREVKSGNLSTNRIKEIDLSTLKNGLYFVSLSKDNVLAGSRKLILSE